MRILQLSRLPDFYTRYDLTIKGTHNFVANGIVVHNTSANVSWQDSAVRFSSGGVNHDRFRELFDADALNEKFVALGHDTVTVYGEAYGGKCQRMSRTYGLNLRFAAFEVKVGDCWLAVPQAEKVVRGLGLEFVHYDRTSTSLGDLDGLRDAPSVQAVRNGITEPRPREGIVLRPLVELTTSNGARVMAKHKAEAFAETKTPRKVNQDDLVVLTNAQAVADEWVTDMRLTHVLQAFPEPHDMTITGDVIKAMGEDVLVEGAGEFEDNKVVRRAISRKTALMFKARLRKQLEEK